MSTFDDRMREFAELYKEPLASFKDLDLETRTELRKAWTLFSEDADLDAKAADLAAVGALMPVVMALESHDASTARNLIYMMLLSLLDANS